MHLCLPSQQLEVLRQRRRKALLPQRRQHSGAHLLIGRGGAGCALQDLDHVKAETAVHQTRQHANFGLAEELSRELGRTVLRGQPTQITALRTAWAVACRLRRGSESVARRLLKTYRDGGAWDFTN